MVVSEGIGENEQELCKAINAKVSVQIDSCSPYAGNDRTRHLSNVLAVAAKEPTCKVIKQCNACWRREPKLCLPISEWGPGEGFLGCVVLVDLGPYVSVLRPKDDLDELQIHMQ